MFKISFNKHKDFLVLRDFINNFIRSVLKDNSTTMVVAFNEAINNVLESNSDLSNEVFIKFTILKERRLIIRIKHSGQVFNGNKYLQTVNRYAFDHEAESGRGIFLMKTLTDYMTYNKTGTEVLLMKKII